MTDQEKASQKKGGVMEDPGGAGEGDTKKARRGKGIGDFGKKWYRFRVLTPTSSILRGSYAMNDPHFKFRTRGRQGSACSVVAIVYGRLFEPKEWIKDYVDQVLEYGDKLFRLSSIRNHVSDDEYMKTTMVYPEFYIGNYKILICAEESGIYGNLFSETIGCSDFSDGVSRFFKSNDAGVVTAQGTSVAMWRHPDIGFLCFDPAPCGEDGLHQAEEGVACVLRFKCLNEMRDHFMKNMNKRYDSRYCIDKVTILRVTEVGRGYIDKLAAAAQQKDQLVVDKSVLRSINPVDIDENKMDCTRPPPKGDKVKVTTAAKFHKEPLMITISNYSIDQRFATEPLVDQNNFDTGYTYENMMVNVPPTFRELPGKIAILHGLTHEADDIYKGKGAQNVANCVMAIAVKKVCPVKTWLRPKLDEILAMGDELYTEMKAEKPFIKSMTAADLHDMRIVLERKRYVIDVDLITITGTLTSKVPTVLNLKQALREFFLVNSEGVIETPSMAVTIWRQDDFFYAFDPRFCDSFGIRIVEDKGKGGEGGNSSLVQGKCCVIRFPDSESVASWFLKNIEHARKNDRFTVRHVTILDDVPGSRTWHDFEPGVPGETWILYGGISNDDESLEDASRGMQGLAIPAVALISAKEHPPPKWTKEIIDEAIRDGDAYYNYCNPGEAEEGSELPMLVSNLKKTFYQKNRKIRLELDDSTVIGDIKAPPTGEVLNLVRGLVKFFDEHQYGVLELGFTLYVAIWKGEEEVKSTDPDNPDNVVQTVYYLFDPNPRPRIPRPGAEGGGEEEDAACVIRTLSPQVLSDYITKNANLPADRPTDYAIHYLKNLQIGLPMSEEELEMDKQNPEEPDMNHYARLAEGGAILQGSFNQGNQTMFKRQTRNRQQAATAMATLAMTKLYNPHLWYREVVDDILKIGDKLTSANLENLPESEMEEETPRNYLLPSEIGEEFTIGVNHITVSLEEEAAGGKISDLERQLETFFETNVMGIIRSDTIMMPVWKEGDIFFLMDPRGRDQRGAASERDPAAVMWYTQIPFLVEGVISGSEMEDFIIDNVTVENTYETRVTETERVKKTTSGEDLWHHFPKYADGVWSIGGNVTMADKRFAEENRNKQSAAIATIAIVFAKVYEPHYWTSAVVDEVIITGDKLHSKCVDRLGENVMPRVNEIITEFFLSSRRIDLTIKDCIEAGDLRGKPPKIQDLQTGIDKFLQKYISGALTVRGDHHIPIWKYKNAYYCVIPDWVTPGEDTTTAPRVFRFAKTETMVQYLLNHLGDEGDYEIAAIDVLDLSTLPPWRFDPSPAVRPSNLPPLNAYRRLQGEARAILRGGYHQGDEIFPEILRNKQTAANCVVALGMSVIKSPITWTKRTMDEILVIGSGVHRETMKAKPTKSRLKPQDIIRIFYVGVNILTADIESNTVTGQVAIPPPDPDEKKKKKGGKKKKSAGGKKKAKGPTRVRAPPPPPILLEEGLRKFFENNRAGILVTDRGMTAIWKDMGVYFMYDARARNDQGLPDFYGTSCVMWFACMEPFYELIFANIDEQEKYGHFEICRVIIKTAMIEPLPCPAGFRPYFDCTAPPIPVTQMKRTTTLAVETVTEYHVVDEEFSVLRGTLHMSHRIFSIRSRGLQSTAIAAVAIVVGLLHVPSTWTAELIDAVLKYGDLLHSDSVRAARPGARNLSPSELLTVFIVGDFRATIHIHNHTTAGILHVFDLSESLAMFFRKNCAGILHTTNMAVAVMQHYGKFYLFDPCPRNEEGRPSFQGAACVMKCDNIMRMAHVFVTNCNLKKPNVYTLNAVNVLSLHFFSDAKSSCPPKCEQ